MRSTIRGDGIAHFTFAQWAQPRMVTVYGGNGPVNPKNRKNVVVDDESITLRTLFAICEEVEADPIEVMKMIGETNGWLVPDEDPF